MNLPKKGKQLPQGKMPSAAHVMHYAGIVREKYLLRALLSASNDTLRDIYQPHEDELVDKAEQQLPLQTRLLVLNA
jgi:replicative DNA helicase